MSRDKVRGDYPTRVFEMICSLSNTPLTEQERKSWKSFALGALSTRADRVSFKVLCKYMMELLSKPEIIRCGINYVFEGANA